LQVSSKQKTYAVSDAAQDTLQTDDQRKLTVEEDFYAISITLRRKFTNQ